MEANKSMQTYSVKSMIAENKHNVKKIDLLFFDILNIEKQSQILMELLENASFTKLQTVAKVCEDEIKKQIKEVK